MAIKIKKYRLIKGSGGGDNANAIGIEFVTGSNESAAFVSKVQAKTIEYFGRGAAGNSISTTYGVHIKFEDLKKNKRIARLLIKAVEIEEELKTLHPKRFKK